MDPKHCFWGKKLKSTFSTKSLFNILKDNYELSISLTHKAQYHTW